MFRKGHNRCNPSLPPKAAYPAGQVLTCLQLKILTTKLRVKPCGHWRSTISGSNVEHAFNNLT